MKKWVWVLVVVVVLGGLAYVAQRLREVYAARWAETSAIRYMEGNDALARKYAQRLRWVDGDESAFMLADLDVTRSIRLEGASRDAMLRQARHRLEQVDADDWRLSTRLRLAFSRAFIDAELGDVQAAHERVQYACKTLRASWLSYDDCMQSIAYEVLKGSRNDALPAYERATLALKIHSGDPALVRFYLLLAMHYLDVDKAHGLRAAMIRDGVYTAAMQHRYCERAVSQDADICTASDQAGPAGKGPAAVRSQ